jgi:coproporphyrinogen III oxidase-like Fe-S oxidoreductase
MDEINKIKDNGSASDSRSHQPQGDGLASNSQSHKKVDETWKQSVEKEKTAPKTSEEFAPPEPDFKFFITTLTLQASIALGHLANPATGKTEQDPTQAKFIIDTLGMLQEKTKGNLTREEQDLLENLLYELRLAFLAKKEDLPK